jgi:5-methylcytosine-specific restriction endonuclease McrA
MNQTSKRWRQRNEDGQAAYNENRRQREASAGTGYSQSAVASIRKLLRDRCAYCGVPLSGDGVVDHVIPIRFGGAHSDDNITLACWKCNGDKHSKTPDEFLAWRRRAGLPVRTDIDWTKFRLPVIDDGLIDLVVDVLAISPADSKAIERKIQQSLSAVKQHVSSAILRLSIIERSAVAMRYGINCRQVTTLSLIGDEIGYSQAAVSGMISNAVHGLGRSAEFRAIQVLLDV